MNDRDKESFLIIVCSGLPFFSVELEMLESSSLDGLGCIVDEGAVIKMRMETVKDGGAS
jgi:hypothetical protein